MIRKEIKNEKQQTRNVKMILLLKTLLPRLVVLVPFVVPIVGDKTLLVWELSSGPTAEALQHSLFTVFSQFGLLYSVRVFPNAAVAGPGFYAIIKFYSARDAHRAQKACDQKQLFQTSPVKNSQS
ncbi:RAD52 motif-containing protein 1-like [Balaenoptera ricei]|uniref:RAD52 motif-containing protein 1-like n=1 Tax=Balaenoptera ricei TaxID=2746895 RepID=UPI0028BF2D27|nr:RAD52 motif-containing protein 1-like [Balaenoptera ricei]